MHLLQHDVNDQGDRRRHHRSSSRCPSVPFLSIAIVIVLHGQIASAFNTPLPHRELFLPKDGTQHHHSAKRNHKSFYFDGYNNNNIVTGLPAIGNRAKTRRITALQARTPPPIDEEEFQRSLLEARIANDVKSSIVKEEKERHEVIAKKIDQEKEELQDAVKDVKEAVREISQSAMSLGGAVIGTSTEVIEAAVDVSKSALNLGGALFIKAPKIFSRLFTLMATSETR